MGSIIAATQLRSLHPSPSHALLANTRKGIIAKRCNNHNRGYGELSRPADNSIQTRVPKRHALCGSVPTVYHSISFAKMAIQQIKNSLACQLRKADFRTFQPITNSTLCSALAAMCMANVCAMVYQVSGCAPVRIYSPMFRRFDGVNFTDIFRKVKPFCESFVNHILRIIFALCGIIFVVYIFRYGTVTKKERIKKQDEALRLYDLGHDVPWIARKMKKHIATIYRYIQTAQHRTILGDLMG